jgi:Uma2 family endonuclease
LPWQSRCCRRTTASTRVIRKCRKYAEWGVQEILVYDPVGREAWYWDTVTGDLIRTKDSYRFHSLPVELIQTEVFRRLDEELGQH